MSCFEKYHVYHNKTVYKYRVYHNKTINSLAPKILENKLISFTNDKILSTFTLPNNAFMSGTLKT